MDEKKKLRGDSGRSSAENARRIEHENRTNSSREEVLNDTSWWVKEGKFESRRPIYDRIANSADFKLDLVKTLLEKGKQPVWQEEEGWIEVEDCKTEDCKTELTCVQAVAAKILEAFITGL